MTGQGRGPLPKRESEATLKNDLCSAFRWHGDRTDSHYTADPTGWWADPTILQRLGPALAVLFDQERPTLVLGPQSRGALLGALVAAHLGIGLVELRKDPSPDADSDRWHITHTPPDYLPAGHRVLLVDDWIDTGGQAIGARAVVEQAGATWCGAAVIVDGLRDRRLRRDLDVRALLNRRELCSSTP